jgi:hypothetical protein
MYICRDCPTKKSLENSKGILHASQGGLSGSSPLGSKGSGGSQTGSLSCLSGRQKQLKGSHQAQAQVHSDQLVPVMARQGG